uniref:Uncharacterized protein n=1 Tax=Anguilla anguilla TaxID=7936 RepID=A0A0E9SPF2_ANGAN
MDVMLFYLERP